MCVCGYVRVCVSAVLINHIFRTRKIGATTINRSQTLILCSTQRDDSFIHAFVYAYARAFHGNVFLEAGARTKLPDGLRRGEKKKDSEGRAILNNNCINNEGIILPIIIL